MLTTLEALYVQSSNWLNDNQGVVGVAIFLATLTLGWVSGIFSALRRRPKFKLSLIDGPTFCCTYQIGQMHGQHEVHRTGIALYLVIANVGSEASSIENVSIGYHWHLHPFSLNWLRYAVGWFWLTNQSAALEDFQSRIGEKIKVYPFLTQANFLSPVRSETFLAVGKSTNGVVYFEQPNSWGGCFPRVRGGQVRIKVRVRDVFSKSHCAVFWVPSITFEAARSFNPSFGKTLATIHGELLPFDQPI